MIRLEIVGEAVAQLSDGFRAVRPFDNWRVIKDLRNVFIHDYANVNIPRVWRIAQRDIPLLRQQMRALLREREQNHDGLDR